MISTLRSQTYPMLQLNSESASTRLTARRNHPLDVFFQPKTVAVIGATQSAGHVGRSIFWNMISSPFGGTVYPVNPKRTAVLGVKTYPSVLMLPEPIDLAIIVVRAELVPDVIAECAQAGVAGAIIISAGFREAGAHGVDLEQKVLELARHHGIRIIGPNCLGIMRPVIGLNATFAPGIAQKGTIALLSQSGAICTALLDWSLQQKLGFSAMVSVGSMVDIGWGTLIDYFGNDPHTRSIVIYMESVGDARSFLSAAREVSLSKPILVIKAGRTELAAKAATSHTGSLAGSDAAVDAAFRRVGIVRIDDLEDVFNATEILAHQPGPQGPRLTIVTNAGGPGVLAVDTLSALGVSPAPLAPETVNALSEVLPAHWSHANPIDIIGDAGADRYENAVKLAVADPNTDGVLVIMTPQAISNPTDIARKLAPFGKLDGKPILASWMGGEKAAQGEAILNEAGIPTFSFPGAAVRAFHYLWRYSYNLRALYETPSLTDANADAADSAKRTIERVRQAGRSLMTEWESKQLLAVYGIPVIDTRLAVTEEEAVSAANALGYPVAVKLNSLTVTHKTDVSGVKLSLRDASAVEAAYREIQDAVYHKQGPEHFNGVTVQRMASGEGYELILGSTTDPEFGPVLLFGTGGRLVEVFHDRAVGLPPLNTTLARRLMEKTRIFIALEGVRGRKSVNMEDLEHLLVRFSQLVLEQAWIREIEINPLFASADGFLALDARVVLWEPETNPANIPVPAIRPYPTKYERTMVLQNGTPLRIRPIRPEDEPAFVRFHATLSDQSVYRRYFFLMNLESRTQHERLTRMCFIDYDRQMALIAETSKSGAGAGEIIGVGRLIKSPERKCAEIAVLASDSFQKQGIGSALLARLIHFARDEGLQLLTASLLAENRPVEKLFIRHGFTPVDEEELEIRHFELRL